MTQRLDTSLKRATPWLVLAGSGPAADFIGDLLDNFSSMPAEGEAAGGFTTEFCDKVREKIRKYFPTETKLERLVDRVSCLFL